MPRLPGSIRPLDDRPHRWAPSLRETSLDYSDPHGAPVRRHVATRVLHRARGWALVAMAFQDWRIRRSEWGPLRYRLARLQRYAGGWRAGKYTPLSAAHVAALGGSLAEFAVDASTAIRGLDPRDRYAPGPRSPLTFLEHPEAAEDEEDEGVEALLAGPPAAAHE